MKHAEKWNTKDATNVVAAAAVEACSQTMSAGAARQQSVNCKASLYTHCDKREPDMMQCCSHPTVLFDGEIPIGGKHLAREGLIGAARFTQVVSVKQSDAACQPPKCRVVCGCGDSSCVGTVLHFLGPLCLTPCMP